MPVVNQKFKSLAVLTTVALSVGLCGCVSKEFREFRRYINDGEYSKATSFYFQNKDKIENEEKISQMLCETADTIKSNFIREEVAYGVALSQLNSLADMGVEGATEYIEGLIQETTELGASREGYSLGVASFEKEDYKSAVAYLNTVIEGDKYYNEAQELLEQAKSNYKAEVLADAEEKVSEGGSYFAVKELSEALEIIGEDSELEQKRLEYEKVYESQLFERAKGYADSGEYENAVGCLREQVDFFTDNTAVVTKINEYEHLVIDEALVEINASLNEGNYYYGVVKIRELALAHPGSTRVSQLKTSIEKSFVDSVVNKTDACLTMKNYAEAYSICLSAKEIMPDEATILERLEKAEKLKPMLLNEVTIPEYSDFELLHDHSVIYRDIKGNAYELGNLYRMSLFRDGWEGNEDGYAKIYLNSQYSSLKGKLALEICEGSGCVVTIVADGETLLDATMDESDYMQELDLDVVGKENLEISISYPQGVQENYRADVLVSGVGLR